MIEKICDSSKCTGCSACKNICPIGAIDMREGVAGHIFPFISDSCIGCKKCINTCPANRIVPLQKPQIVYAAWAIDDNEHETSTSGGVAACFTNTCIDKGGVVYGVASLPHGVINHIRVDNKTDAYALKGSKYVHSHIHNTFKDVKKDLDDGRDVLFIGLPCQVAGLKNYLEGKDDRLVCVDLICHGVPSQAVLFNYLEAKGFKRFSIESIQFRDRSGYNLTVIENGRVVYSKPEHRDLYYMAFNDNLCFRDSCFTCRYATSNRCGDLTIGDFWGLGVEEEFNYDSHGNVSVIFVNNGKGSRFLNHSKSQLMLVERTLNEAVAGNHNLNNPSVSKHSERFRNLYSKTDIITALSNCLWRRRIIAPLVPLVKLVLEKRK